jgi:hypothetical protein
MPDSWRVVGASVRGVSHQRSGQPCQDAHSWRRVGSLLIAAVADGAGSAPLAEVGSGVAVHAALEATSSHLEGALPADDAGWQELFGLVLQATRQAIESEAATRQCPPQELATTLLIAVVGEDFISVCQVGDGAIVIRTQDNELRAVTGPQPGEYINETTFVTSANYQSAAQFATQRGPINGLILLSDGLQMLALKMPQGTPHSAFFTPLLQFVAQAELSQAQSQLEGFLQSPRVTQRADDDLTLVLAVR